MKCITYVSKFIVSTNGAMIPSGLSDIYKVSRKRNSDLKITGVISYKQGRYIQVLEGNDKAIDQLLEKIKKDPRHSDVTVLLDFSISKKSFPNNPMRMVPSVKNDSEFVKFVNGNSRALSFLDDTQLKLFEFFYNTKNTPSQLVKSFVGKKLMLTAWPDFTVVMPTPGIIELGAKLTSSPWPYNELVRTSELGDESKLNKALITFNALGILKVVRDGQNKELTPEVKEARPSGFYVKMKTFLGFGK